MTLTTPAMSRRCLSELYDKQLASGELLPKAEIEARLLRCRRSSRQDA